MFDLTRLVYYDRAPRACGADVVIVYLVLPSRVLVVFELPELFQFYQNYPNPFNSETTIAFDVYEMGRATLKIYNSLGQEIITLVDRVLNPGKKRIVWQGLDSNGRFVSSGVYFCEIVMGDVREVRKMVLAK